MFSIFLLRGSPKNQFFIWASRGVSNHHPHHHLRSRLTYGKPGVKLNLCTSMNWSSARPELPEVTTSCKKNLSVYADNLIWIRSFEDAIDALNAEPGEGESCPQLSKWFAAQESRSKSLNGHYHQHFLHDHGNEKDFHDDDDHADCW